VDRRNGGIYVAGSRVSLASVIYAFRSGESADTIQQNFPSLTLAQVYSGLAFYLNNEAECEAYLRDLDRRWDELEKVGKPVIVPQHLSR
jgi:uncharacterized protein (DUF433 family)